MKFREFDSNVVEGDLTPMIDMAFQLIAFFLLLMNFSDADQDQRVRLPSSELAKPADAPLDLPLFLHLTREGRVIINGEEVPLASVRPHLDLEASLLRRKEKSVKDSTVVIRADARAQAGYVQDLIKYCQEAEFEQFALRVAEASLP